MHICCFVRVAYEQLGLLAHARGRYVEAANHFDTARKLSKEMGDTTVSECLRTAAATFGRLMSLLSPPGPPYFHHGFPCPCSTQMPKSATLRFLLPAKTLR